MTLNVYKIDNPLDQYRIQKKVVPSLPFKIIVIGKSDASGKTTNVLNMLTRPFDDKDLEGFDYYVNDFLPENIYIVSRSLQIDNGWIQYIRLRGIPPENLYNDYNEKRLTALYYTLRNQHISSLEMGEPPVHSLIIFDDVSADGSFKKKMHGVLNLLIMEGRHSFVSTILTTQYIKDIPPGAREGAGCFILYRANAAVLDKIYEEVGMGDPLVFKKAFRRVTKEPRHFMVVMQNNPIDRMFLDHNWTPIPELCTVD